MLDPIAAYYECAKADLDEFGSRFTSFGRSAYRLEMLPVYSVPEEEAALQMFRTDGKQPPAGFNSEWHEVLDTARDQGKRFSRTRLIQEVTPYIKFEIAWGYSRNILHGEQINIVEISSLEEIAKKVPVLNDFWLFDECDGYLMQYDAIGRFLGVLKLSEDAVPYYVALMNELCGQGVDIEAAIRRFGIS